MKRILVLIMTLSILLVITSCSKDDDFEIGLVTEIANNTVEAENEVSEPDKEFIEIKNGYAGISMTLPNWNIDIFEANIIKLSDENKTIYIEISPSKYNEYINGYELNEAIASFSGKLLSEDFSVDENTFRRRQDQEIEKREGPSEENTSDKLVVRYDIPNLNYEGDTEMSESRYYYFTKGSSVMFSIIAPKEDFLNSCNIIDDIFLSIKPFTEEFKEKEYTLYGNKVKLPNIFHQEGGMLKVPSQELSILSETTMFVVEDSLSTYEPEELFSIAFSKESPACENRYMKYPLTSPLLKIKDDDRRLTECMIYRTELNGDRLIYHLLTYYFEEHEIDGSVVVLGYPSYAHKTLETLEISYVS